MHIGTNDATKKSPGQIKNEINNLTIYIKETLPDTKIVFSLPTLRTDNYKAENTLDEVRNYFKDDPDIIVNNNIDRSCLGRKGLQLNPKGNGRLAINFISFLKCL